MIPPTTYTPGRNSLLQTLAEAYLERGEFAEAAERFSELVHNGLQTPNVYRNLTRALLGMKSFSAYARQVYEHVLTLFPNERELCVDICKLLLQHKAQDPAALKCYQQTLALNPPPERELLRALAAHLHGAGYQQAAFEIVKRLALLENGGEAKTLALLTQFGRKLGKQNETRNLLLYLEGRNERSQNVKRMLAFEYAREYLHAAEAPRLGTKEWQAITQVTLGYTRLENMAAAREYATLRLALAHMQSRSINRQRNPRAHSTRTPISDFLERLPETLAEKSAPANAIKNVYGLRLDNLAQIAAEAGEALAQNLAQKFLRFAGNYLIKAASAQCHILSDGLLAFADSLHVLAHAAVEVLHKIERYNLTAAKGAQLFAQTAVHSTEVSTQDFEIAGLQVLYETLHLLEARSETEHATREVGNRLYLPRAVYEQTFNDHSLPARPLDLLEGAGADFRIEVYQAVWRNPLEYVQENAPYDFGRFTVTAKLRGTRAAGTYRGRDRHLERSVILKTLNPHLSLKLAHDAAWREQVVETLRNIGRLEAPGIAAIYDMGFEEDIFFFAREYLEGQTLANILRHGRRFSPEESVNLTLRICRILSLAHRRGVCHGNLKPANIWLLANDEVKIADFYVPGFVTKSGAFETTSSLYVAPELLLEFPPNAQSDIYALGILLYELLAGKLPLAAENTLAETERENLPSIVSLQPELPHALDEIFARACHKNAEARYKSLFDIESALRQVFG